MLRTCRHMPQSHARHYIKPRVLQVSVDHRDFSALITGGGAACGGAACGGAAGGGGGAAGRGADVQTPSTSDSSRLPLPPSLPQSPPTTPSPNSGAAPAVLSRLLAVPRNSSMKPPTDAPVRGSRHPPLHSELVFVRPVDVRECSHHMHPPAHTEAQQQERELDAPCRVAHPLASSGKRV